MARDRGVYNMSGNIELSKEAPLDARRKVNTFAELFLEATWKDSNNKVWLYDGMTVEVGDRLGELWQLKSKTSYSRQEDWVKISGGIEEAPKDGNPYMRKNGAWNAYTQIEEVYTFVADINGNKISQDAYNGLKAAVKAGKVIAIKLVDIDGRWIVSLSTLSGDTINLIVYVGDAFQTIVIKSDLSVTETNKNFILRDNTSQYEVTGDYNPAHKKYVDTVTNNIKNNVLLKNNTTNYTPTQDYHPSTKQYVDNSVKSVQDNVILKNNNTPYNPTNDYNPATKKYVDDKHIILTITNEAHMQLISNQEVKAGEAESKINLVFGSIDNFKNIIQRLSGDTILFLKITEKEILKVSVSHTYCNPDNGAYELSFIYTFTSIVDANNISLVTKRIFIALNSNITNFFVVKDILVSDNLTTLTKKTAAEYEAIGSKDGGTMYAITDA